MNHNYVLKKAEARINRARKIFKQTNSPASNLSFGYLKVTIAA